MANPDRLTGLDASFLALEKNGAAHMHVGSVLVFEGPAPDYDTFLTRIEPGLHPVPRYRQRIASTPLPPGRPALPAAARRSPARAGPSAVGRRSALQPALPPAPHGASRPRGRRRAA